MSTDLEFSAVAEPFRPELLAHCYRMLGSVHDAEDLVQETYLRAWRAFDRFEGRSSVRTWLYKIATMACLTALETRARRPLPSGLGAPSDDHRVTVIDGNDPAAVVARRHDVRLAFIAALQYLSARQRAVLTLRDVLAFRTAEVAEILDSTPAAVDSALRRARARLAEAGLVEEDLAEPDQENVRILLDGYVEAFIAADLNALTGLLRADVELEMPPIATWFTGRPAVAAFLANRVLRKDQWRLVPSSANGQPAVVIYQRAADGDYEAYGAQILTLIGPRIARITAFIDPTLVPAFGFPRVLAH
jgi:RNA polymerase sigma factor (sigma-70 family)